MKFGNGSIVYTPKRWIGEKVLVILEKKPLDVAGETIEILKPHLGDVEGIFLFGSFARNEQTSQSDIDVIVISGKIFGIKKTGKFDFTVKTKSEFAKEMKTDPTLFLYQIAREGTPILNESVLNKLKSVDINPNFEKFFDDTIGAFKSARGLLAANKKFLDSNAAIYSLVLRLKGLFIIQCYKKNLQYSGKKFMELIKSHGFSEKTADAFLEAHRTEQDNRKAGAKISTSDAKKLFEAAKLEFLKAEALVK